MCFARNSIYGTYNHIILGRDMATVLTISFPKRAVSSSEHVDLKGGVIGE
jgi:hypothetical protein